MRKCLVSVGVLLWFALSACGGGGSGGQCPLAISYHGDTYYGLSAHKPVTGDEALGRTGFSFCDDGGGSEDTAPKFSAMSVAGIDPSVAIVVPSVWPRIVFYNGDMKKPVPPEVAALLGH